MDFPFFCKFTQIADETIVVFLQFFVKLPKNARNFREIPCVFVLFTDSL
jgi:hypothetical protein